MFVVQVKPVDLYKVNISSGNALAGLELDPQDLIRAAGARLAPVAKTA